MCVDTTRAACVDQSTRRHPQASTERTPEAEETSSSLAVTISAAREKLKPQLAQTDPAPQELDSSSGHVTRRSSTRRLLGAGTGAADIGGAVCDGGRPSPGKQQLAAAATPTAQNEGQPPGFDFRGSESRSSPEPPNSPLAVASTTPPITVMVTPTLRRRLSQRQVWIPKPNLRPDEAARPAGQRLSSNTGRCDVSPLSFSWL